MNQNDAILLTRCINYTHINYVQLTLSYLTLSPGKLLHNPKKSFFSGCFHPFGCSYSESITKTFR